MIFYDKFYFLCIVKKKIKKKSFWWKIWDLGENQPTPGTEEPPKGPVLIGLMNLSKAFDTLNHNLLLAKLDAYGFDNKSLLLIKSYLENRWQRTKIDTTFSTWSELLSLNVVKARYFNCKRATFWCQNTFW